MNELLEALKEINRHIEELGLTGQPTLNAQCERSRIVEKILEQQPVQQSKEEV